MTSYDADMKLPDYPFLSGLPGNDYFKYLLFLHPSGTLKHVKLLAPALYRVTESLNRRFPQFAYHSPQEIRWTQENQTLRDRLQQTQQQLQQTLIENSILQSANGTTMNNITQVQGDLQRCRQERQNYRHAITQQRMKLREQAELLDRDEAPGRSIFHREEGNPLEEEKRSLPTGLDVLQGRAPPVPEVDPLNEVFTEKEDFVVSPFYIGEDGLISNEFHL